MTALLSSYTIGLSIKIGLSNICLLYTSDAADDSLRVDLGGRRIIKKMNSEISTLLKNDGFDSISDAVGVDAEIKIGT